MPNNSTSPFAYMLHEAIRFSAGFRDALHSVVDRQPAWSAQFEQCDDGDEWAGVGDVRRFGICPFRVDAERDGAVTLHGPDREMIGRFLAPSGLLRALEAAMAAFDPVRENRRHLEDSLAAYVSLGTITQEQAHQVFEAFDRGDAGTDGPYYTEL